MASVKAIEARKRAIEQELLACESELGLHASEGTELGSKFVARTRSGKELFALPDNSKANAGGDVTRDALESVDEAADAFPSYSVTVAGKHVPVTFSRPALDEERFEKLKEMGAFNDWCKGMDKRLDVKGIDIQCIDMFGPRVGFVKFKADVLDDGLSLPSIVFMRGGAVGMLPVFIDESSGKKYTVLTVQARVPAAIKEFPELPAGMLDGSGDFAGVAAKELKEEMGLTVTKGELIDLTPDVPKISGGGVFAGIYPSAGGCDEFLRLFLYLKVCAHSDIMAYEGKLTGELKEGEKITLKIIPLEDISKHAPDVKALSAYLLYQEYLKREMNRLKEFEAERVREKKEAESKLQMSVIRTIIAANPPSIKSG
jgi:ADP-sugar diphosphatase